MPEDSHRITAFHSLLTLAAAVVAIAGLKAASSVILPVIVAVFLAVISIPPINWLKKHRLPGTLAGIVVFVIVLSGVFAVSVFVGASVKEFASNLDRYERNLQAQIAFVLQWAERLGVDLSTQALRDQVDAHRVMNLFGGAVTAFGAVLSNILFVLVTLVFILAEAAGFSTKLEIALADTDLDVGQYRGMLDDMQGYLAIKTLISLVTGSLAGLLCSVFGIDYPLVWGLVAFLLNYIPSLGSIIAALPAVIMALVQYGWDRAVFVALGYLVINISMGNFLEPKLMGKRLGLSALVVFLSMIFWGWIWGPVGMVLCVPLTMLVKIWLESSDDLAWLAVLLGSSQEARDKMRIIRKGREAG